MGIESRGWIATRGPFRFQFNADGFGAVVDTVYKRETQKRFPIGIVWIKSPRHFVRIVYSNRGIETRSTSISPFLSVFLRSSRELSPDTAARYGEICTRVSRASLQLPARLSSGLVLVNVK